MMQLSVVQLLSKTLFKLSCVAGGGGGGRKAGDILLLYSTGLCTPPWRQFTSSEFVLCSACGFLCMKYVHSNPTFFFFCN